jgi:hypothetical protein
MSGCFGNSAEDRYMERQLNEYLDSFEDPEDDEEIDREEEQDRIEALEENYADSKREEQLLRESEGKDDIL